MKIYLTSLKSSLFLSLLLMAQPIMAGGLMGKVKAIKGEVFIVYQGQTKELKNNADIMTGTQILVSDGAEISWNDFHDHVFHLNANSHLTLAESKMKLVRGSIWVQSLKNGMNLFNIETMNGLFEITSGESILTYDSVLNKSQILVISGEATAAGTLEPTFKYALSAGQFTFLQPEIDQGAPRTPTKAGYDSLISSTSQFHLGKSMDPGLLQAAKTPVREIASVKEMKETGLPTKKGEVTFITTRVSAEASPEVAKNDEALNYYLKSVKKTPALSKVKSVKGSQVVVKIWGQRNVEAKRNPASVAPIMKNTVQKTDAVDPEFMKSLQQHESHQPTKPAEVQNLIDDLKSF